MAAVPPLFLMVVMCAVPLRLTKGHVNLDTDEGMDIEIITEKPTSRPTRTPPNDRIHRRLFNPEENVSIRDYPFMASVLVNKEMWCAAVIIRPDKVLTAARCLQIQYRNRFFREYLKMITVRVGSSYPSTGGEIFHVKDIDFHPNFKQSTLEYNLVVLKLYRSINFYKAKAPIDVAAFAKENYVPVDKNISFIGWNSVASAGRAGTRRHLQRVELPVYDLTDCQEVYGRDLVRQTNFCAGFISVLKNICNHDSGGAALMDGVVVGILSFTSRQCNRLDKPAVFMSVGAVSMWLKSLEHPEKIKKQHLNLFDI